MVTDSMKRIKHLILFFGLALALTGCPDPVCFNPDPTYTFAVTARFIPEQDSIRMGDTLYLVSEFPSAMVPVGEHEMVDYTNSIRISNTLRIGELVSNEIVPSGAVDKFEYFIASGNIYNSKNIPSPDMVQQLVYEEVPGKYILKIGLIAKSRGVFAFGIGNGGSSGKVNDKCLKANFLTSITNLNPNLKLYEEWSKRPIDPVPNNGFWIKVY